MTGFVPVRDADLAGKAALVRLDLNVPVQDNKVSDTTRLQRAKPNIEFLRNAGAKVILLSHFGRPGGKPDPAFSLRAIIPALERELGCDVGFAEDCFGPLAEQAVGKMRAGDVLLLENTRFHAGESKNDAKMAAAMATLGDLFVSDAFSVVHRAHVSTVGLAEHLPAFVGLALERELDHLNRALGNPQKPVLAVVGGAKVSTKIDLLRNLVSKVNMLCIGGGMANTFLFAKGMAVGASLCEPDLADTARMILNEAQKTGCEILLPMDVVVASKFAAHAPHTIKPANQVADGEIILDAGPQAVDALISAMDRAKTIIWNGPLGAFELPPFDGATIAAARAAAVRTVAGKLVSVAGGGDTVAALNQAEAADDFTFISTAGGAFLEWMEGKELPGIACLFQSAKT